MVFLEDLDCLSLLPRSFFSPPLEREDRKHDIKAEVVVKQLSLAAETATPSNVVLFSFLFPFFFSPPPFFFEWMQSPC